MNFPFVWSQWLQELLGVTISAHIYAMPDIESGMNIFPLYGIAPQVPSISCDRNFAYCSQHFFRIALGKPPISESWLYNEEHRISKSCIYFCSIFCLSKPTQAEIKQIIAQP